MKKILLIALLAFVMSAKAQITLLYTCDSASSASTSAVPDNQLMMINFSVSGERYVKINRWGKSIEIFDISYNLLKTIDCSGFPLSWGSPPYMGYVMYLSQNLFSTDSKIDFMYVYAVDNGLFEYTQIYNEDGALLFSDTGFAAVDFTWAMQQNSIFNTSKGTEMILSYNNGQAKVFSLPGTLTTDIEEANNKLIAIQSNVSNPYPNPNNGSTKIDYTLPPDVNEGEIVLYNLQGMEVKRFKVDKTFNTLLISTKDIAAGTYYYQLQTAGESTGGKKMVVIK
jgi:hypothetical protein